jgi:serine/threonine protein kinase
MSDQPLPDRSAAAAATSADEDRLIALAEDFAARLRRGELPSIKGYIAEHPELADQIRAAFPAIAMVEQARAGESPAAITAERAGTTVGHYKLLERIGEGGFGVVYMAEQLAPVRRKVALKIVKPGMDSRQVLARFEAERQALAIMDHANIAKVFDGGMTDSGRPYFVMELVRGEPITAYCDANQLSPRQRLELFVQVCNAVQHAHQKGIIHRDLQP